MQTFLPYPDIVLSVQVLDRQRLGKQRVEALQILNAISGKSTGWRNHPATRMWRNNPKTLAFYGMAACSEWMARGYRDSQYEKFQSIFNSLPDEPMPTWFGDSAFHESHKSNLVRKLPAHYQPFFPEVPDNLPYVWPV